MYLTHKSYYFKQINVTPFNNWDWLAHGYKMPSLHIYKFLKIYSLDNEIYDGIFHMHWISKCYLPKIPLGWFKLQINLFFKFAENFNSKLNIRRNDVVQTNERSELKPPECRQKSDVKSTHQYMYKKLEKAFYFVWFICESVSISNVIITNVWKYAILSYEYIHKIEVWERVSLKKGKSFFYILYT